MHSGRESTFSSSPLQRNSSDSDSTSSLACSAAAGFDVGRGKEEPAAPLLGDDGGGNGGPAGGDGAGGNGVGKLVDEGDGDDADDDTLLSLQQVVWLCANRLISPS